MTPPAKTRAELSDGRHASPSRDNGITDIQVAISDPFGANVGLWDLSSQQ